MSQDLRILVSCDYLPNQGYFIKKDLVDRLKTLGAKVIPLFYDANSLDQLLAEADGILIPGSKYDVCPERFTEHRVHPKVQTNKLRCDFEWSVLDRLLTSDLPILGICWGFQLMNVFQGGSLFQHLPDEFNSSIEHEQKTPSTEVAHEILFDEKGCGPKVFGVKTLGVNSTHHQGIRSLGKGLVAEAQSPDGLIECFRFENKDFAWAVEWHPERLGDDPILPAFLEACRH